MTLPTYWVIVDVGCIECGESTSILGVYTDVGEAKADSERRGIVFGDYFNGGQHSVELHPWPVAGVEGTT